MARDSYKNDPENDEIEIDLRGILEILQKWYRLILAGTLICAISAALISYLVLDPVYQSRTLLMVTQATERLQPVRPGEGLEDIFNTQIPVLTMNTYVGQIKSEALLQRVKERINEETGYTVGSLAGLIEAAVVKDTNLIEVKVSHGDPVAAAKIANILSQEYLKFMNEKNQEQMTRSVEFLQEQKSITDAELDAALTRLQAFQSESKGVELLEAEFNKKSQDMVNFASRLKMVQVEVQQLTSGVASLELDLSITPRMIAVERWNNGVASTTNEINPLYTSIAQQLTEKKSALAEKEAEAEWLQIMLVSLEQELNNLQTSLVTRRMEQDKLQREVDRLRATSETLANKTTETQIMKSIDLGDTSVLVVSEASVPSHPVKPNKKLNIAIAVVLGLMIFTLLAFVLEYLDNTLKTPEDINKELGLPVLGVIPKMNLGTSYYSPYGGNNGK